MSFLKSQARPLLIFAAFAAGGLLPAASAFSPVIRYLLMGMLYLMFLTVRFSGLKPAKCHWRILAFNIVIGCGAWGLALLTGSPVLALAAFFTGIAPTASAAPVIMKFLGGSVEFVLTGFLLTNGGIALALTALVPLVTGNFTLAFLSRVAVSLATVIGIPMLCALLTRKLIPDVRRFSGKFSCLSFLMWVMMLFITAASASHTIRSSGMPAAVLLKIAGISAAVAIVNFSLGYCIGDKQFRRESSQTLGQKNTMLLMYVALTFGGPLPALGPTFYVFWHNLWNAFQMFLHDRKKSD